LDPPHRSAPAASPTPAAPSSPHHRNQRRDRSPRRPLLLLEDPPPPLAHRPRRLAIRQQIDQRRLQLILVLHNANPILRNHLSHHIAEVLIRRPHHYRHTELRRLQRIMPPPPYQTPAHKRHRA